MSELTPVRCGCGGEAKIEKNEWHDIDNNLCQNYKVYCYRCDIETTTYPTEAEAVQAWNKAMGAKDINVPNKERTAKVKNIAHVRGYPPEGECGNCGFDVIDDGEYCPGCGAKLDWSDHV